MSWPASWLMPDWPAPPGVRAVCTTREGGVSAGPYASLNLADHVGDDPRAVASNRRQLATALGVRPVFLRQVHGTALHWLDPLTPDATEADACATRHTGVACTVMVADCLPVLVSARNGAVVAAAHAGWRGLAGGVLEATVQALLSAAPGLCAGDLQAWLGPCIGPEAFEVGAEVLRAMTAGDADAVRHFKPAREGKYTACLAGLACQRLQALGVRSLYGNDGSEAWCTVQQDSVFFSHRRDGVRLGGSGRLAACIWRA